MSDPDDPGREHKGDYENWEAESRARREAHRRRRAERGPGRDDRGERKERVLHTRITEDLSEDIRRVAEDLRVPVSNLVRNVLEDVFTVVESVADNMGDVVDDVMNEVERAGRRLNRRANRYAPEPLDDDGQPDPHVRPRREERRRKRDLPPFPDVAGWQPLILNSEQTCAGCGTSMQRGARGFVGLGAADSAGTYLCRDCAREVV